MAAAATDSDFSDGASVWGRDWEVIDYLSLEAASMKTFKINISDQAGTLNDVETPSKDKSMEHINKIVAKRIEFTEPYDHVHKEIHVAYQQLRDLKVSQAVMHPMQYRFRRRVLRVDRNECRKEMRLIGDIVAWMQRLKIALRREVAVALESMGVRMEAQEARQHVQAEGRESRPWSSTSQPLETACATVLNINISFHTAHPIPPNPLPTIPDLLTKLSTLDDWESAFLTAYIKSHTRIHDLNIALRILETTITTVHPEDYDKHKFMQGVYLHATRESIQVVRDGIRWVRKLKKAVRREVDVAEGPIEARMRALEARRVVQAEAREPRGVGGEDAAGFGARVVG